jgi:hypothetical protein
LRAQLFAHGLLMKYQRPPGTVALDFLSEYFGARFSSAEMGRLAGEKLYRKTGRLSRRSATQALPNFSLTLNITPQLLASHTNLVLLSPARETVTHVREGLRGGNPTLPVVQAERSSVSPQRAARRARERKELLTVHERIAREIFSKVKPETAGQRDVAITLVTRHAPGARHLPQGQPNISLTRHDVQTLLLSQPTRASFVSDTQPRVRGSQPFVAPERNLITRAYVSPPPSDTLLSKAIPRRTASLSEGAERPYRMPAGLERAFLSAVRREGRGGLAPSGEKFAGAHAVRLRGGNPSAFIGPALAVRHALHDFTATKTIGPKTPARPRTFRSSMTPPESDLMRGAIVLRAGVRLISQPHAELERVLVALRQETRLELPPVARVFAPQPQRSAVDANKVVKQVEEKEVIETIKREVTTQMKSYRTAATFTRAEFTAITDHVYDALARRLLNERERLGLNS